MRGPMVSLSANVFMETLENKNIKIRTIQIIFYFGRDKQMTFSMFPWF